MFKRTSLGHWRTKDIDWFEKNKNAISEYILLVDESITFRMNTQKRFKRKAFGHLYFYTCDNWAKDAEYKELINEIHKIFLNKEK